MAEKNAAAAAAIEYRDVAKAYGEKTVLEHFDLTVEAGEFLTVVGTSGSGKTTVLKMANGLIVPTAGQVLVGSRDVATCDQVALRRSIGYAIQGSVLFPHLTVEENIAYVPNLLNGRDHERTRAAVRTWLGIVGLSEELLERYPAELSGGQAQRVGIARALAASPGILLMDEPFGAVDEITRGQLQDELLRIWRETGITAMFVTHDISEALKLGTRVLVMDEGRVEQCDRPEAHLARPATEFVARLVERERRMCRLPEEELAGCPHSGVARGAGTVPETA